MSDETTNERIARLGFVAHNEAHGMKRITTADGICLMVGTALEVSRWLDGFEHACAVSRELSDAREALGLAWLAGGATLAEGIQRKVRMLEGVKR